MKLMQIIYSHNYPDGPSEEILTIKVEADSVEDAIKTAIPMIQQEIVELIEEVTYQVGEGEFDPPSAFTILLVRDMTNGEFTTIDREVKC